MALRSPILIALLSFALPAHARLDTPATRTDQSRVREHAEQPTPAPLGSSLVEQVSDLRSASSVEQVSELRSASSVEQVADLRPAPLPLPPRSTALESRPLGPAAASPVESMRPTATGAGGWLRVTFALGAVISLIFALRWALRRAAMRTGGLAGQLGAGGRAPSGVLEVLGRFPVARGQTLVLLRLDRRILLISQSTTGMTTLAEVSDPEEMASLITRTRDDEGASAAARFNAILRNLERDPDTALATIAPAPLREPERVTGPVEEPDDPVAAIRRRLVGLKGASA